MTDYEGQDVEESCKQLENIITKTPKKDIIIVQGDWKAKAGLDAYEYWAGTMDRFGWQTLSAPTKIKNNNVACSEQPDTQPHRLHSGTTAFQVEYQQGKNKSFPGADIGSNHNIVLCSLKLNLNVKCFQKSPLIHFDLQNLKDPQIAKVLQAQASRKFAALNIIGSDINTISDDIKEDVLGR